MFALGTKICAAEKMRFFRFMFYLALTHSLLSPLVLGRSLGNNAHYQNDDENTLLYRIDKYLRNHPDEQLEALLSEETMAPSNDASDDGSFAKRSAPLSLPSSPISSSSSSSSGSSSASAASASSSNSKASHEAFAENILSYIMRFYKLLKHNQMNPAQRNMIMIKIGNLKNDLMNYLKLYPENEESVFLILNRLDYEADSGNGNDENKMRTKQPFKWGK